MRWAIITLNRKSIELASQVKNRFGKEVSIDIYTMEKYLKDGLRRIEGGLGKFNETLFRDYKVIIYVMAMGIVVRDMAPYLKHKSVDPAVLCISIDGSYVIPVLSGHLGGANELAYRIASGIKATPVITTASDILDKMAVDMFAKKHNFIIGSFKRAKDITAMMINNEQIEIISDIPLKGVDVVDEPSHEAKGIIHVSYKTNRDFMLPSVTLIPKKLVVGIGARRGTPYEVIKSLLDTVLIKYHLSKKAIKMVASIDLKKDEVGVIELAKDLDVPFMTYKAKVIQEVMDRFEGSEFVEKITGVGAVSMPSGYLASNKGLCIVDKVAKNGITLSIWEEKA